MRFSPRRLPLRAPIARPAGVSLVELPVGLCVGFRQAATATVRLRGTESCPRGVERRIADGAVRLDAATVAHLP